MAIPDLSWGGLANGRVPRERLVDLGGGKLAQPDAAAAFRRLAAAFRAQWGNALYVGADQDVYRDVARQQFMLDHPERYPHAKARAGTSVHGWGRSFDLTGYGNSAKTARHVWLQENVGSFGFSWAYGRALGEAWHFDYVGPITAGGGASGFTPEEEEEMTEILMRGDGTGLVTLAGGKTAPANAVVFVVSLTTLTRKWLPYGAIAAARTPVVVPQAQLDVIPMEPGTLNYDGSIVPVKPNGPGASTDNTAALLAAIADLPTAGEIATAAADEEDRRDRERLKDS